MPTVQGAGSVNPTITNGTDSVVFAQAASVIQNAMNVQTTVVGGGFTQPTVPTGVIGELVVSTQSYASVYAPGFQYFVVGDALNPISVTAGGALNQAVILGAGPITFLAGGGSGMVVAGDGDKDIELQTGTNFGVYTGAGDDTINSGASAATGRNTVEAGTGHNTIDLGAAQTAIRSIGSDTIAVSAGAATVQAVGSGQVSVSGGAGARTVINASGASTVSGGSGTATVLGGAGGGQFAGGSGGNNLLVGGAGGSYLTGGGNGDVLIATSSSATQVIQAGAGNETLLGSLSSADNTYQAGSGSDLIIAGAGNDTIKFGSITFASSTSSSTVTGGAGYNHFIFNKSSVVGANAGAVTITDFTPGTDIVQLVGSSDPYTLGNFYNDQASNLVAAAQHPTATSSRVVLSDGTSITFLGLSSVSASYFGWYSG